MITRFSLRNFKAFGTRRELAFRPLTVLTGLNSAGKSSVIQSILLAKQAASRTARVVQLNGPYGLALGESQDVLNSESTDQQIEFTFTYLSAQSSERTVELSLGTDPPDALNLSVIRNGGVPPQLEQDDRRFTYLCAERLGPREMLELSAEQPDLVGVGWQGQYVAQVLAISGSEHVRQELQKPRENEEPYVTTVRTQVEYWMSKIVRPIRISAERLPRYTAAAITIAEPGVLSEPRRPANVGFGISYSLPIVVAALVSPEGSLLIVENPEAHLHPAAQSQMGRFLGQVAASGVQVLIETHSDHVLNGIRLAVGYDKLLSSDNVVVHFFGAGGVIEELHINASGSVTSWPEGFFDQLEQDLSKLASARRRRPTN
ncbi:MAG TPA: DUF3696 domain-containing protein [Pseudonocardiaceae bacterium]